MSDSFIVLTPAEAKRLAKTLAKARTAVEAVGVQLVAIGVSNMLAAVKKAREIKKPRKAKAPKAGKNAPKADKPADPLTA